MVGNGKTRSVALSAASLVKRGGKFDCLIFDQVTFAENFAAGLIF